MNSILIIDATEEMRPLAASLEDAGYAITHVTLDGAIDSARDARPAAALITLSGRGDSIALRNARASDALKDVPAIAVIRAEQLASFDVQAGFDDFIVSSALPEEVVARVRRAIWARSGVESDNTLRVGDLLVDLANYKVFVTGRPVDLTYKEYELLRFLATNREKVFTREALLNRVWGYDFYGGARTVDVHIRRLRSKIEDAHHTFIETVRNVGYRFHDGG